MVTGKNVYGLGESDEGCRRVFGAPHTEQSFLKF